MKRILKFIKVINPNISLPEKSNKKALTVFLEMEDLLFHTYIYDENFGFLSDP
jgi:TFIIF-interacting CTD phosphatase-like protein